ncbi:MAG: cohesin domain-containing protein [candidate division KSB1 bacterium]|nr:cohesin domain-containing protein [candidate division KSB1 bacterium]
MNLRVLHKKDSLHLTLPFEGARADTQLTIPSGIPVRFLADVYKDSRVIMQGDTTITAGSGEKIDLYLSLKFVTPAVISTPSTQDVQAGDSVSFDVAVRAMQTKFYKAVTRIEFDPNILSFRSAEKDKHFLKQNAGDITVQLTDTEGLLIHDVEITPKASAVSGNGNLTTLRMQALRSGRVSVTISNDPDVEETLGVYDRSDSNGYLLSIWGALWWLINKGADLNSAPFAGGNLDIQPVGHFYHKYIVRRVSHQPFKRI